LSAPTESLAGDALVVERDFELAPADNDRLANLCGPLDDNLRQIESRLGVEVRRRGSRFHVQGGQAGLAEDLLRDLFRRSASESVTPEGVHLALREHEDSAHAARHEAARGATAGDEPGAPTGGSAVPVPPDAVAVRTLRGQIRARGANQREYLARIRSADLTFGVGPAGTGKTYLAVACAVEALQSSGCAASCWCGRPSKRASGWASCPAI
jgi:phosphate starvation-inducible protein PhoH and related proteins